MTPAIVTEKASRLIEFSLLFLLWTHLLAMVSMVTCLMPAMPGSFLSYPERVAWIAEHPWQWHLGWIPWHLAALSDLVLAFALLKTSWIPKLSSLFVLVMTVLAVAVEQPNEILWNLEGVRLARLFLETGDLTPYTGFESAVYLPVCVFAAVFYAIGAIGWSCCFAFSRTWSCTLTVLSAVNWPLMAVAALAPLTNVPLGLVNVATGIGFNIMALWMVLITECVLLRSRPDERYGRMMPWKHPDAGLIGKCLGIIANSRLLQYVGEYVKPVALVSDIKDVVYINYLVDAKTVEQFVPPGLTLRKIGPTCGYALFSVLTYTHGNFGPRCFGPLRKFCPSPVQSNWRIHVTDSSGAQGIYFISTAIDDTLLALAARWLSDGVPMHVLKNGAIRVNEGVDLRLEPGRGSAPHLEATLRASKVPALSGLWTEAFEDYEQLLAYCVPQDRAMSSQPWYERTTRQEINLNIPLSDCMPLEGSVYSRTINELLGEALLPICFRVPTVNFVFEKVERSSWM